MASCLRRGRRSSHCTLLNQGTRVSVASATVQTVAQLRQAMIKVTASKPLLSERAAPRTHFVYPSLQFVRVSYRFLHSWDRVNLVWKESRGAENYVVHYHYL